MRLAVCVFLLSCGARGPSVSSVAGDVAEAPLLHAEAVAGVSDPALRLLLHEHWEATMARHPTWATQLGDHRYDERLSDRSDAAHRGDGERRRAWLGRVEEILQGELSEPDRLTARLFATELQQQIDAEVCAFHLWSLSPRGNVVAEMQYLPELHAGGTPLDRRRIRSRMAALPQVLTDELANLRLGKEQGLVANAESTRRVIEMVKAQIDAPTDDWPGVKGFEDPEHLRVMRELVDSSLRPMLTTFAQALEEEILPVARAPEHAGMHGLPSGEACYAALVRSYTTLEVTAEDRHAMGLHALAGIHEEMAPILADHYGTTELRAGFDRIRSDPEQHFATAAEIEEKANTSLARAEGAMAEAFGRLPKAPCVVRAIPAYEAPYTHIAYYRPPHTDGTKPGEYFVNTYAPETRPRFEAEVLAFHESIPGHHLQIAISQELSDVPAFRKHMGMTAFVEGWALYTERLADEMGLYTGELDRFGMLSFDSWRAARLVVDTGLHVEGWTRQQAIDFMLDNTPLARNNIENEVDRYLTWPGQALAYKSGQLELLDMRAQAEEALGEKFELADFHDVVLGAGAVTLPVLRARVDAWVISQGGSPAGDPPSPGSP